MIVACESMLMHAYACLPTGGGGESGGMPPPQENFEF